MPSNHELKRSDESQEDVIEYNGTIYDLVMAVLAFLSLLNLIALFILPRNSLDYIFISIVDMFIALVFLADFIRDFYRAEDKLAYMRWGWIALLAGIPVFPSMPTIFNLVRIARLIRLIQILRELRLRTGRQLWADIIRQRARGTLLGTMLLGFILIVISSFLIVRFETGSAGVEITSVAEGFYWALITITTVGYGDFVPVTFEGRMLAGIITLIGIIIVAVGTSYVTSSFQGGANRQEDFDKMVIDVAEMKQMLQEMLDEKAAENDGASE